MDDYRRGAAPRLPRFIPRNLMAPTANGAIVRARVHIRRGSTGAIIREMIRRSSQTLSLPLPPAGSRAIDPRSVRAERPLPRVR